MMSYLLIGPLVRATSASSGLIWGELSHPATVTLQAIPANNSHPSRTIQVQTVNVGNHHYFLGCLNRLQPATWYNYHILHTDNQQENDLPHYCFRTLDVPESGLDWKLAYGSCRKPTGLKDDALGALGEWLIQHFEDRESSWPRLLLLIGDQVYADQPVADFLKTRMDLPQGARTFSEFAAIYNYAWTNDPRVRQVLAILPSYMIFDDHEIINSWNIAPWWRIKALAQGLGDTIIDGLIAYWVYQGWGNLDPQMSQNHPFIQIMQHACKTGEDAYDALKEAMTLDLHNAVPHQWHYQIPTSPPIFVSDMRADRPAIFTSRPNQGLPGRIISSKQMSELAAWLNTNDDQPAIIVSSVPVLLPPLIGLAEYMMGIRPFHKSPAPLRWLGGQLEKFQQTVAARTSFDHWPVFPASWQEFIQLLGKRKHDLLILSGDVHFSYAMEARATVRGAVARLLQFVASPIQNQLDAGSLKLIRRQAHLHSVRYGGIRSWVLPLVGVRKKDHYSTHYILKNTLSFVNIKRNQQKVYTFTQEYMSPGPSSLESQGQTLP